MTLKEIAKYCDVSITTVSNVLNGKMKASEETTRRILKAAEEFGYNPSAVKTHSGKAKKKILMIAEDLKVFSSPVIAEAASHCFEDRGWSIFLANMRLYDRWKDSWYDQKDKYQSVLEPILENAKENHADGIVFIASHARVIDSIPEQFPIPTVMAYGYSSRSKIPCVVMNDKEGSYELIRYLIGCGHTRIGVIAGREDNIHTQKRIQGYRQALFEAELSFDSDLVAYGDWHREDGERFTGSLLEKGVTAVFAMSDVIAGGVYDYCEKHGLTVGKDISLVGYDNLILSRCYRPELTTTELPLSEIGEKAAELLIRILEEPEEEKKQEERTIVRVKPVLIERGSVVKRIENR